MIYSIGMEYLTLEEKGEGLSDEELLAASVAQPSLFALIVRKYEAPFLRKANSIIRDEDEAVDIVQETFAKIYLNANKFKKQEGAQFSSWGYRILINTALTHYAKRKRAGQHTVGLDDEIWQLIPDKSLRQFERKELEDYVASILSRMPESLARALSAFFLEGKPQEQIAEEEGLSVGAIKTRVHRAKAEFRRVQETLQAKQEL
jgi:RNA polymerase sigma-70 factor (ECF subfamily)